MRWLHGRRPLGVVVIVLALVLAFVTSQLDDTRFDRVVGWANIIAAVVAVVGMLLALFPSTRVGLALPQIADKLAEAVLADEGHALDQLLHAGRAPGRKAEVSYYPEIRFAADPAGATGTPQKGGTLSGIAEYYREHTAGRLVVLGEPGAGKTVLLLTLLSDLAQARQQRPDHDRLPVPVRFDLARWDPTQPLREWLAAELQVRYTNLTPRHVTDLIEQHLILPVLDGLDEAGPESGEPTKAQRIVDVLNQRARGDSLPRLVVACRTGVYTRLGHPIADAVTVTLQPVTPETAMDYLERELAHTTTKQALTTLSAHPDSRRLWDLTSIPWMLTLLAVYLRDGGQLEDALPRPGEPTSDYQARVRSLLLERYIPARVRASHDQRYAPEDVRRWVAELAVNLGSDVNISLHRIWPIGGRRLVRSLHVLLAAIAIFASLAVAVLAVNDWDVSYLVSRVRFSLANPAQVPRAWWVGATCFAVAGAWLAPWVLRDASSSQDLAPARPITLSVLRTARGRRRFARSLAVGLAVGLALGLAGGLALGLAGGLAFGLALGLADGLALGLAAEDVGSVSPTSIVYSSLAVGLAVGLAIGLAGGLAGGLAVGLALGLALGLAVGQPWLLRYVVGLGVAGVRGRLPVRLIPFLEWAADVGVLRRSGPFYQFRHLSLRDHLQAHRNPGGDRDHAGAVDRGTT